MGLVHIAAGLIWILILPWGFGHDIAVRTVRGSRINVQARRVRNNLHPFIAPCLAIMVVDDLTRHHSTWGWIGTVIIDGYVCGVLWPIADRAVKDDDDDPWGNRRRKLAGKIRRAFTPAPQPSRSGA